MQIYCSCSGVCLVTCVTENEISKLSHTVSVSAILEITRKLWENHNLSEFYRSSLADVKFHISGGLHKLWPHLLCSCMCQPQRCTVTSQCQLYTHPYSRKAIPASYLRPFTLLSPAYHCLLFMCGKVLITIHPSTSKQAETLILFYLAKGQACRRGLNPVNFLHKLPPWIAIMSEV